MVIEVDRESDDSGEQEKKQSYTVQDRNQGINLPGLLAIVLRLHDRAAGNKIARHRDGENGQNNRCKRVLGNFHDDVLLCHGAITA